MKTMKLFICLRISLPSECKLTAQPKPWVVPENLKSMKNPIAKGDASTKAGVDNIFKELCIMPWKNRSWRWCKSQVAENFPG